MAEEAPLLFDLPLAAPPPADRRARRRPIVEPVQADLFVEAGDDATDDADLRDDLRDDAELDPPHREHETSARSARGAGEYSAESEPDATAGPVVAGVGARWTAGLADFVLHLGVLGGAYLGVLALDVEPRLGDWPAFATLLLAFSFLSSVVSLAFWGQTAGMAWRGLQTRDRLQRPLTFRQASLRWTGGLLTFATAGIPLLFALGGSSLSDWLSRSVTYSVRAKA
jgi:RDD family protein